MSDSTNFRLERVEKLLRELEYEITRGMMEGEIDETVTFRFIVPISKQLPKGIVVCEFNTRPQNFDLIGAPRLRLVKT